jgi:hypothetical protein
MVTCAKRGMQRTEILCDNNRFLDPFEVDAIPELILRQQNIVLPRELILLDETTLIEPGTYDVPLALMNDEGEQVIPLLQLAPKQATFKQLKERGLAPQGQDEAEAAPP